VWLLLLLLLLVLGIIAGYDRQSLDFSLQSSTFGAVDINQRLLHGR